MEYLGEDKIVNNINPLVSVIIPAYQHVSFIKKCLESILIQETTFPYEIILGEDDSKDGTREICIEFAKKNTDKIRLFLRSKKDTIYINGAPTGRYNFVENIKSSRGKYIAICEGDDYWIDPLKLQRQTDFLESNSEYSLSAENSLIINYLNKTEYLFSKSEDTDLEIKELIKYRRFHLASVVFPRQLFQLTKSFMQTPIGDTFLFIALAKKGKIHFRNVVSSVYNRHEKGITEIDKVNWPAKIESFNKLLDEFTHFEYSDILKKNISKTYFNSFKYCLKRRKAKPAFSALLKSIKYSF